MGIILYEFLVGCVPFYGDSIEDLFAQIVTAPIEWPEEEEWRVPDEAVEIISMLLERDPLVRLGTTGGATQVKEALFFAGPPAVDWNNLLRQKAAFVPQLQHDEDTSYFDPRTERYHHDIESDEDISFLPGSTSHSGRSSPLPLSSTDTRASSTNAVVFDQGASSSVRRPAASRLGREKQQQAEGQRRCHSLNDTACSVAHSRTMQPRSQSKRKNSAVNNLSRANRGRSLSFSRSLMNSNVCRTTGLDLKDIELTTATLTAESVASRNALHMLQNLTLETGVDNELTNQEKATEQQATIGSHKLHAQTSKHESAVQPILGLEPNAASEDDDVDDDEEETDPSTVFHSFTSYSPRFSVVLEQAQMNEALAASSQYEGLKSGCSNVGSRVSSHELMDGNSPLVLDRGRDLHSGRVCSSSLTHLHALQHRECDTENLSSSWLTRQRSEQATTALGTIGACVQATAQSITPIKAASLPNQQTLSTSVAEESPKLTESQKQSGSSSSLELSQHGSFAYQSSSSSDHLDVTGLWVNESAQCVEDPTNSSPITEVFSMSGQPVSSAVFSEQPPGSLSADSSSSSSLSLTTLTPRLVPSVTVSSTMSHPSVIDSNSPGHQTAWSEHIYPPVLGGLSTHDGFRPPANPITAETESCFLADNSVNPPACSNSYLKAPSDQLQIGVSQPPPVLMANVISRMPNQPVPQSSSNLTIEAPLRSAAPSSTSDGRPIGFVLIQRGKAGYGFTIRAIRVYFGSSNRYTLHHLVHSVDRDGPAAMAGLTEGDLITAVNGIPIPGMLHTQVVKLILQSGPELRLFTTPIQHSFIRSDGPWRPAGRLVPRTRPLSNKHPDRMPERGISSLDKSPSRSVTSSVNPPKTGGQGDSSRLISDTQSTGILSSSSSKVTPPLRRSTRRLTIRETRHRHLGSGPGTQNATDLEAAVSNQTGPLPSRPPPPTLDHLGPMVRSSNASDPMRIGPAQPAPNLVNLTSKTVSQNYNLTMAQRFGLPVNPVPTNVSTGSSHGSTSHLPIHRRSIEKPLLRQLNERQHRAMLAAQASPPITPPSTCPVYSQASTIQPFSCPIPPHTSVHRPDVASYSLFPHPGVTSSPSNCGSIVYPPGSTLVTPPGFHVGGDSSTGFSPNPSSSMSDWNNLGSFANPAMHNLIASSATRQQMVCSLPTSAHASSYGPMAASHSLPVFGFSPTTQPQSHTSSHTTQNPLAAHLRHSDPPRCFTPTGHAPTYWNSSAAGTSGTAVPSNNTIVEVTPNQLGSYSSADTNLSTQASALVSSGQVRLRRRSHLFAVQHVASPDSPTREGESDRMDTAQHLVATSAQQLPNVTPTSRRTEQE
ncbi:hypothetical protein AHF37_02796 [Paragonimus kellicotti]|nr:hypothetical protein AHF37_02796 [Paragonimus kellicotti]